MMLEITKKYAKCKKYCWGMGATVFSNLLFYHQKQYTMNPVYITIVAILIYVGLYFIDSNLQMLMNKRTMIGICFWAVCFSLMVIVGEKINTGYVGEGRVDTEFYKFGFIDAFWFVIYVALGGLIFSCVYLITSKKTIKQYCFGEGSLQEISKKRILIYAGILIIAWSIVAGAYYPGIIPGDAWNSISIITGELEWGNHFPVAYTGIIGLCIWIGERTFGPEAGIALYSVLQMVSMGLILGYMLFWLETKGIRRYLIWIMLTFFVSGPVFGNYAIVMWKDPWFSGSLLLMFIFLYDCVVVDRSGFWRPQNLLKYTMLCLLICLLRSNGVYVVLLLTVFLLLVYRKSLIKAIGYCCTPIAIVLFITGPVYDSFMVDDASFVESVGIPYQQMARVIVKNGDLNDTEKEFLNNLLPIECYAEYYNPFLVDPLKWASEFDKYYLTTHKEEFFKNWLTIMWKNLDLYIEQYLMGTYGFWHIGGDVKYEFIKEDTVENPLGVGQKDLWNNYLGISMKDSLRNKYDFIPSGLLVWVMLTNVLICWIKRKEMYIIPMSVMIGNWLTLMIGTPSSFGLRYIYILMIGLPLLCCYPWIQER